MSQPHTLDLNPPRPHSWPVLPVVALGLGIVVMAATAFSHLIDEPQVVPFALLTTPVALGALVARFALRDERLPCATRPPWAAGLVLTGIAAVLACLVLMTYVLPLSEH